MNLIIGFNRGIGRDTFDCFAERDEIKKNLAKTIKESGRTDSLVNCTGIAGFNFFDDEHG